ncbi:GntR family transcriptional regulator [Streptomyces sp. NPDC091027]|uniref:GntR family transcriptional regulator n=1 Tax=Streptomyces sp. NPDC091027 TaxID=3365971 RepID=UPI0038124684
MIAGTSAATKPERMRILDRACVIVYQHITTAYPPGTSLPSTRQLALALALPQKHVHQGLLRLDSLGEIALHTGSLPVRLRTREPHPRDRALHGAVRDRIRANHYRPGQALPTGLLGEEFGLLPHHVQRALRFLTSEGTLRYDERGAHGPGHYVPVDFVEAVS